MKIHFKFVDGDWWEISMRHWQLIFANWDEFVTVFRRTFK